MVNAGRSAGVEPRDEQCQVAGGDAEQEDSASEREASYDDQVAAVREASNDVVAGGDACKAQDAQDQEHVAAVRHVAVMHVQVELALAEANGRVPANGVAEGEHQAISQQNSKKLARFAECDVHVISLSCDTFLGVVLQGITA